MAKGILEFCSASLLFFISFVSLIFVYERYIVKVMEESSLPLAILFINKPNRQPTCLLPCHLHCRAQRSWILPFSSSIEVRGARWQFWPMKCKWISSRDSREDFAFSDKRYIELPLSFHLSCPEYVFTTWSWASHLMSDKHEEISKKIIETPWQV